MTTKALHLLALPAVLAALAAGCGGDSDDNGGAAAAPETTATQPAAGGAQEVTGGKITVEMSEYAFKPKDITASAGKLVITAPNVGKLPHELVLLKTDKDPGSFPVEDGRMDEEAPGVKSVGEIEETAAGKTGKHTFDLEPGKYAMVCNITGHYAAGMWGSVVVK